MDGIRQRVTELAQINMKYDINHLEIEKNHHDKSKSYG